MTDRTYKLNQWYRWAGGECPVPEGASVTAFLESGVKTVNEKAKYFFWHSEAFDPILAFCVTEYPDEVVTVTETLCIYGTVENEDTDLVDATCTYRNGKLVEVHWKDESDE